MIPGKLPTCSTRPHSLTLAKRVSDGRIASAIRRVPRTYNTNTSGQTSCATSVSTTSAPLGLSGPPYYISSSSGVTTAVSAFQRSNGSAKPVGMQPARYLASLRRLPLPRLIAHHRETTSLTPHPLFDVAAATSLASQHGGDGATSSRAGSAPRLWDQIGAKEVGALFFFVA